MFSGVNDGSILLMWCMYLLHCVVISIYKEYRVVMIIIVPIRIIVILDYENDTMTTSNSPIKLVVGGSAKLVRLAKSHQAAISGRSVCNLCIEIIAVGSFII